MKMIGICRATPVAWRWRSSVKELLRLGKRRLPAGKCVRHPLRGTCHFHHNLCRHCGGGMEYNMNNRLEELRKERGLRQEELADILEVSRQTIGSLENGRYNPSILLAFKIARFFNKNIEDIFIYEEADCNE